MNMSFGSYGNTLMFCNPIIRNTILILTLNLITGYHSHAQVEVVNAIEQANTMLWEKFVDKYGIVNDFVGERPSPFDCRLGRPNAIGWWSPIEDGAFFTGLYLVAACERARIINTDIDRDKARVLAQGLLKLSSISDVPGFIARGVSSDGKTHYPTGSTDQTFPWYYGLYTYLKTDIPTPKEREIIKNKMIEVVNALKLNSWKLPCDGMFTGTHRDALSDERFLEVTCFLYVLRTMYELTGDKEWLDQYYYALKERPNNSDKTRAEICAVGVLGDSSLWGDSRSYLWIYVKNQAALAGLLKMEKDESIKKYYQVGVKKSAAKGLEDIGYYTQFDNEDKKIFGNTDWRAAHSTWYPQVTQADAYAVSKMGDPAKIGERKRYERAMMTNPLAAACIVALTGDKTHCKLIEKVVSHYDYSRLNLAEFFFAEFAYYAMTCHK